MRPVTALEVSAAAAVTVVAVLQSGSPLWGFSTWSMSYPVTAGAPDGTVAAVQLTVNPATVTLVKVGAAIVSGTLSAVAASPVSDHGESPAPLVAAILTR